MTDITLRQLHIFAKVVELGSFNQCAKSLDISSVAITGHIKKLEDRLGHKLFHRHPGEVAILTTEGENDYKIITGILSGVSLLLENSRNEMERQSIRIAMDPFIYHWLENQLTLFQEQSKKLSFQIELENVSGPAILEQIKGNLIDFGFFYALADYYSPDSEFVCNVPLAIYVGLNHPLAQKSVVTTTELLAYSAIETSKNNHLNALFNRSLEQVGIKGFDVDMQTDNMAIFSRRLSSEPVFSCMLEWVEIAAKQSQHPLAVKRLSLERPIPALQIRSSLRSPLQYNNTVNSVVQRLSLILQELGANHLVI